MSDVASSRPHGPLSTPGQPTRTAPAGWLGASRSSWVLIGLISYIPLLLTKPGLVAADTKQYLYLDPGRLLQSTASMWDPNVGLGTVTHQNIGFLFPMGPYYWLVTQLHIPIWVGQRIWMGSLLFAAGTGVLSCCKHLGLLGPGRFLAALTYMLTPFIIDYIGRISAILLPWAALGWMLTLVILGARRGGWRYPALFALVVALVGGVNATSILLIGLGPVVWLGYAVWATHETTGRRALGVALRIGLLGTLVSLWWAAGLWAEGAYGIAILQYTETVPTVALTSLASEALRGLGYWFFYGQDKIQQWTSASVGYTQSSLLIGVSFAVPALSFLASAISRWRYRAFAVGLVLVGTVTAVGTYPYANPSPLGGALKAASTGSTIGLAMRSSNRVVPLIVLGLALLLGSGLGAVLERSRGVGLVTMAIAGALVLGDLPALWTGNLVADNLARPSALPSYWTQAAAYLNAQGAATRVLGLPGQDFAAYRWGVTEDPVATGLLTRPYVARQVVPQGEPASVDLLSAFDGSLQNGVFDPSTLAPIAQLMSAGQVLVQSDLQYERYNLPRPQAVWQQLQPTPPGLSDPRSFGTPAAPSTIKYPLIDETQLGLPPGAAYPPPLATFTVANPRPIIRAEPTSEPLLVAGNGQGLVDLASTGLLANNPTIFYSGSFAKDSAGLQAVLSSGADLVLTDTNALAGRRWGSLTDNIGYVQQANETPLVPDPSSAALPVFPGAGTASNTVAELNGVASIRATDYGNPITYTPENRPANALDGHVDSSWTAGAFSPAIGARLEIQLLRPTTTDHLVLLQPQVGPRNRDITRATLSFDGGKPITVRLGPSSLSQPGQTVSFPSRAFQRLDITVSGTNTGIRKTYDGQSAVGFAEVGIPNVSLDEVLRLPTDLLSGAGTSSLDHRLVILLNRDRAPSVPPRSDPQLDIARTFTLPTARTFALGGTARVSAQDSDFLINQLVGLTPPDRGPGIVGSRAGAPGSAVVVAANSSTRLPGDLAARANAAADGDPSTAWSAALGPQAGEWLQLQLDRSVSFDHLDLALVNDGRHSLPKQITITTDTGAQTVTLPTIAIGRGRPQGATTTVPVSFPTLSGRSVKVTIDATADVSSLDYVSDRPIVLPVAIAELGVPGVSAPAAPAQVPTECRSDLLSIDGHPVDLAVSGSSSAALASGALQLSECGSSAGGVALGPGPHVVRTSPRLPSGFEVDQLSLSSERGGAALAALPDGHLPAAAVATVPVVTVKHQSRTSMTLGVRGDGQPFWLVLGQSMSRGWTATLPGGRSLGRPQLIDGFANGWLVPAGTITGPATISLSWTPQNVVWAALGLSGIALLLCVALAIFPLGEDRVDRHALAGGPILASPLASRGARPPIWVAVLGAAVAAGLAALVIAPVTSALVGPLVLAGLLVDRARLPLAVGGGGLMVATGVYVMLAQHAHRFLPNIQWAGHVGLANTLAWVAVSLLGADALVEGLRWRAASSGRRRGAR